MRSNYSNLMLLLVLPLTLAGCQLACDAEKVVSQKLATSIATVGNCSGVAAIQADVQSALNVVQLCSAQDAHSEHCKKYQELKQGPVASVVCPLATTALVAVVGSQVPANWQCRLVGSPLQTIITTACQSLPF